MSLPVFLHPDLSSAAPGQPVAIDGGEGHHAVTVKRIQPGEKVVLADAAGFHAEVTVTVVSGKDYLEGTVNSVEQAPRPTPRVTVVQAIPKTERAEQAVDLATQGGADAIIAWAADRCIAKWDAKKAPKALAKWQAAAIAAAKQSRRPRVPEVTGPLSTRQLCERLRSAASGSAENGDTASGGAGSNVTLVLHEEATVSIKEVPLRGPSGEDADTVTVLVGPEGGIGRAELDLLMEAGAVPVKLGPEVLRTASAAFAALAALGMRTERW